MSQGDATQDLGQIEAAWLGWLQQQADSIMRTRSLPAGRAATDAEVGAFFEDLKQLENACVTADSAAAQLAAAGYRKLADRLAAIRNDVRGARDVFKQPPSRQPGPISKRMLELKDEQRSVEADSTTAGALIKRDPVQAAAQLAQALVRSERMFDAQTQILQQVPWGAAELPHLQADRLRARVAILKLQGLAATALADFDAAQRFYERALANVDQRDPEEYWTVKQAILDVNWARMAHRGRP